MADRDVVLALSFIVFLSVSVMMPAYRCRRADLRPRRRRRCPRAMDDKVQRGHVVSPRFLRWRCVRLGAVSLDLDRDMPGNPVTTFLANGADAMNENFASLRWAWSSGSIRIVSFRSRTSVLQMIA